LSFFTRYLIELLVALSLSNCGCIIGNMPTNVFAYADYLVILAPCWSAMQALLVICKKYCDLLDLRCNTLKTVSVWSLLRVTNVGWCAILSLTLYLMVSRFSLSVNFVT